MPATVQVQSCGMLETKYIKSLASPGIAPGTPNTKSKCIGSLSNPFFTSFIALSIIPFSNISTSGFTPYSCIIFAKLSIYSSEFMNTSLPKLQVPVLKDAISGFRKTGCILSSLECHTAPPVEGWKMISHLSSIFFFISLYTSTS